MATLDGLIPDTRSVPLAWRNLTASRRRLLRSTAGIGFAVLLMLVQLGFERAFFDASLADVRALDGDLFVLSATKYRFGNRDPFPPGQLAPAAQVPGIASVSPLYLAWQQFFWKSPEDGKNHRVQVFAFDPSRPVFSLPGVEANRQALGLPDTVLVDSKARGFLGMATAAEGELNGTKVRVVGRFELGPNFLSDGTVMMSGSTFAALLTGKRAAASAMPVEAGVVRLEPGIDRLAAQRALAAALPTNLRVMTKPELVAFERHFQAELSSAGPIFWMGTVVGFVVGMLISYQIIYTDLSDQRPQYAMLKGMGYRTGYLVRVVMEQACLSALAAYVPAWLLCLLVYRAVAELTLLPLHMTAELTLLSFALTLGMCLLSAGLAVRRVVEADPAENL